MAVVDTVDRGHVVVFDSTRSFVYNKETGVETEFVRRVGGWDTTLDLEAPDIAKTVNQEYLAQITTEVVSKNKGVTIVVQPPVQDTPQPVPVQPEGGVAGRAPLGPFGQR